MRTYKPFHDLICEKLEHYVYGLRDPRDGKIFYIGKGVGNRVYNHVSESLDFERESDKLKRIRAIHEAGQSVEHFILRHGLTDKESIEIEAACIDLYSQLFEGELENEVLGHHSVARGYMSVDEVCQTYNAEVIEAFPERVMIININTQYRRGMSQAELYEATRAHWKVSLPRASKAQYVVSSYRGIVRAVFKVVEWMPSESRIGRFEFNGCPADPEFSEKYLNKSLERFLKTGAQNPIFYSNK